MSNQMLLIYFNGSPPSTLHGMTTQGNVTAGKKSTAMVLRGEMHFLFPRRNN